jgi:oligosaccharide repeat unit polymerase
VRAALVGLEGSAMTFWMQLILALSLIGLSLSTAWLRRDPGHPSVLVTALWGGLLTLFHLLPHSMYSISLRTTLLIVAGVVCFWVGCLAVPEAPVHPAPPKRWQSTGLRPALFWISLAGLPVYCLRALDIADSAGVSELWFVNLRIALTLEGADHIGYGVLAYLVPVAFTSTFVELAASRSRFLEWRGWLVFLSSLVYAVLSSGRTYLVMLLFSIAFILLLQGRVSGRRILGFGIAGVVVIFFGVGALANKIVVDAADGANLTPLDSLALYIFSPLSALDLALDKNSSLEWGLNVLRSPLAVLNALGLDATVVPLVKEFVFVPEPTNVYTVFLPYVQDFGAAGALLALALFGAIHTHLFVRAKSRDPRYVIGYSLSIYPLGMQFFQDQYFSLLTTWVLFGGLIALSFRAQSQDRRLSAPGRARSRGDGAGLAPQQAVG